MHARIFRVLAIALAVPLLSGTLTGCATSIEQMTPQQREAFETRRFCESQGTLETRCIGFQGWW